MPGQSSEVTLLGSGNTRPNDSNITKVCSKDRPVTNPAIDVHLSPDETKGRLPGLNPDGAKLINLAIDSTKIKGTSVAIEEHENRVKKIWPTPSAGARAQFKDFCAKYDKIKAYNRPNYLGARIPLASDLNIEQWRWHLQGYHDEHLCDFLEFGWPLGYHADNRPETVEDNHPSAKAHNEHVEKFVQVEMEHKAILGPFAHPPFVPWSRISPIMTRPKRDSEDRRIIIDLSYPVGMAVNDGIQTDNHFGNNITYSLSSISDLIERVKQQGRGCYIWKADLTRAYRQWRVDPLDTPFLGMKVNGEYFLDLCPPFGCRSSAAICQKVANAVTYMMNKKDCYTLAYLDDYAGANATELEARRVFQIFGELTAALGLRLADHKCCPPTKQMEWLGYLIDTDKMQVAIPPYKLGEVIVECNSWLNKSKVSKKMIQSIAGKLVYISNCIISGRKFKWFATYAEAANGILMFPTSLPTVSIECDSSLKGAGGHDHVNCYTWAYAPKHRKVFPDIVHLEAINVVVAFRTLVLPTKLSPAADNLDR